MVALTRRIRTRRNVRTRRRRVRRFRRRTYRRRRTYKRLRRSVRGRTQPKTVNMKYKTVHSVGDFINLPHRLSDSPMLYWAGAQASTASPVTKALFNQVLNQLYSFLSTDYLSNMDKVSFTSPTTFSGPPSTAVFNAWNPYLDASLLGPNYNVYAKMYNYFKYKGIKVKWIPNVKTSNLVQPQLTGIPTRVVSENQSVNMALRAAEAEGAISAMTLTGSSNSGLIGTGTGSTAAIPTLTQLPQRLITGTVAMPRVVNLDPEYEEDYGYAPSLKMHVLFSKDDFSDVHLPADPLFVPTSDVPSPPSLQDTVYKYKPYTLNMKTQNYKIYDMSKPFKFYCRPYCSSGASESLGFGDASKARSDASIITVSNTTIFDGNKIVKKKRLLPRMVVDSDRMTTLVSPANTTVQQKWQARVSDANFFNPILFGYFFTVDGLPVDSWMKSITNLVGQADFDKCVPRYSKLISSYGHFEITVYAQFNELNNTLIE